MSALRVDTRLGPHYQVLFASARSVNGDAPSDHDHAHGGEKNDDDDRPYSDPPVQKPPPVRYFRRGMFSFNHSASCAARRVVLARKFLLMSSWISSTS